MVEALQTRCGRKLLIYIVDGLSVHGRRWLCISLVKAVTRLLGKAEIHGKQWYMPRVLRKPSNSTLTGDDERC
jgi:hypothetical protein